MNEIWMPHPAHFICALNCRFHLATYVNGVIVSTVGDLLPDEGEREILAKCDGVVLEGRGDARRYDFMKKIGYVEIGFDRKYETMVFRARAAKATCCPFQIVVSDELDFEGYNDAGAAAQGHREYVAKWRKAGV